MAKTASTRFTQHHTHGNVELLKALNGFSDLIEGVQTLTPTAADTPGTNLIDNTSKVVRLGANVTDANDWVTLPRLSTVPNGHTVLIIAGAANCEVRTPAASAEEINSEDC